MNPNAPQGLSGEGSLEQGEGQPSGDPGAGPDAPHWADAIGSSAGGLESRRPLVRLLLATSKPAYPAAQHLPRETADGLSEIVARDCAFPVVPSRHGMRPFPGRSLVAPPGRHTEVQDGILHLALPDTPSGVGPSID